MLKMNTAKFFNNFKSSPYYKKIVTARSFHRKSNYIDYKKLALYLACILETLPITSQMHAYDDLAFNSMVHSSWMCYHNPHFPIYALSKNLLDEFLLTEVDTKIAVGMIPPFNYGVLVLPQDKIISPDGLSVDFLCITIEPPGTPIINQQEYWTFMTKKLGMPVTVMETDIQDLKIRWATTIKGQYSYTHFFNAGDTEEYSPKYYAPTQESEAEFINKLTSIVLQTLLFLHSPKETKTSVTTYNHKPHQRGYGNNSPLDYRVLDVNPIRYNSIPRGGSHASPRMHPRMGHWRKIRTKHTDEGFRYVRVRPTMVNSK